MFLEGRGAVVTGGGRGIGAAVARALVGEGARVVVAARTEGEIEALAAELIAGGGEAWAVPCDVTREEQVEALRARALERLGAVDVLVNNAGIAESAPLKGTTPEMWDRIFAVNARGVYLCTRAFLPGMLERGEGRVVNVASVVGKVGAPYISAYSASKHAVVGFTRAVASEAAPRGVTVNAVCPGYVDTPLTDGSIARIAAKTGMGEEEARAHLRKQSPQNRMMEPEEVAYLVVALCHPLARGINGQSIVLDGGAVQG